MMLCYKITISRYFAQSSNQSKAEANKEVLLMKSTFMK